MENEIQTTHEFKLLEQLPSIILSHLQGIGFDDNESLLSFKSAIVEVAMYGISLVFDTQITEFCVTQTENVALKSFSTICKLRNYLSYKRMLTHQNKVMSVLVKEITDPSVIISAHISMSIESGVPFEGRSTQTEAPTEVDQLKQQLEQLRQVNQQLKNQFMKQDDEVSQQHTEVESDQPQPQRFTLALKLEHFSKINNITQVPSNLIFKQKKVVHEKRKIVYHKVDELEPADKFQKTQESFLKKKQYVIDDIYISEYKSIYERLFQDSKEKIQRLDVLKNHIETLDQFKWEQILSILSYCSSEKRPATAERPSQILKKSARPQQYFQRKTIDRQQDPEEIFNFLQDEFSCSKTHYMQNMLNKFKRKTDRISGQQEKSTGSACFMSRTSARHSDKRTLQNSFHKYHQDSLVKQSPSSERDQ